MVPLNKGRIVQHRFVTKFGRFWKYTSVIYISLIFGIVFQYWYFLPFPSRFDELAHVSYAVSAWHEFSLFPRIDQNKLPDGSQNYLVHPSLYYLILGGWANIFEGSVLWARLFNVLLHFASIGIVILALPQGVDRSRAFLAMILLSLALPLPHVLGGLVTNDNLVFFAGAIMAYALSPRTSHRNMVGWAALSVVIAGWSKLNALVLLYPVFFVACIFSMIWYGRVLRTVCTIIIVSVLCAIPYLVWLDRYGSVTPIFFVLDGPVRERMSVEFVFSAIRDAQFYEFLSVVILPVTHSAFEPYPQGWLTLKYSILTLAVSLPVIAFFRADAARRRLCIMLVAYLGGLCAAISIHMIFIYRGYECCEVIRAFHFRYYIGVYPLMIFAAGCVLGMRRSGHVADYTTSARPQ